MKKPPLSEQDWILIHRMNYERYEIREIARTIGRPEITVKRALKRFFVPPYLRTCDWCQFGIYCYEQSRKKRRRSRQKPRLKNEAIKNFVKSKLEQKWSPEAISMRIGKELWLCRISVQAIYDWIYFECPEYEKYLVRGKYKKRCGKPGSRKKRIKPKCPNKVSIEHRPESANDRSSKGSLEGDLIIGSGDSCLLTLVNRRTRRIWIRKVKSKEALAVFWVLAGILRTIPESERLTLTLDNGGEFAKWVDLEETFGIWVYFCHAYCSFEKGSIENRNGVIRNRFFPKGTNFDDIPNEEIIKAENWMNNYPMKVLGGLTPLESEAKCRMEKIKKAVNY